MVDPVNVGTAVTEVEDVRETVDEYSCSYAETRAASIWSASAQASSGLTVCVGDVVREHHGAHDRGGEGDVR